MFLFWTDYQAPRFTSCPLDFPVYADRGLTQAFVSWEVTATDNSGEDIVPLCDREFMTYPIGDYFTSCSARDSTGNIAICQFWFRVRSKFVDLSFLQLQTMRVYVWQGKSLSLEFERIT